MSEASPGPVSVETVFDRFPASVRGAVVVRAVDREPHQIRLLGVDVVEAHDPSREIQPVAVDRVTVDVAPHREVLIPFDVPFSGLGPGWYCVAAEIEVDGSLRARGPQGGGKRFVVPWPATDVRRGDLRPELPIPVGRGVRATVDRVELKADRAVIRWRSSTDPRSTEIRVAAGSRRLPVVESDFDERAGAHTTITHPVPKRTAQLTFELAVRAGARRRGSATLDLP